MTPQERMDTSSVIFHNVNIHHNIVKKIIYHPWCATLYAFNLIRVWITKNGLAVASQQKRIHHTQMRNNRSGSNGQRRKLTMMAIMAMSTRVKLRERSIRIDTAFFAIGIDNRASYCISPEIRDFIGPMVDTKLTIKGFLGATTHTFKRGTVK